MSIFLVCHGDPVENKYMYIHILTPFYVYYMNVVEKIENFEFPPATHMAPNGWHFPPAPHAALNDCKLVRK